MYGINCHKQQAVLTNKSKNQINTRMRDLMISKETLDLKLYLELNFGSFEKPVTKKFCVNRVYLRLGNMNFLVNFLSTMWMKIERCRILLRENEYSCDDMCLKIFVI